MHAKRGQFSNGTPKDLTTSIQAALENFLKIKKQDRIPDTEIMKRAGMQTVHQPVFCIYSIIYYKESLEEVKAYRMCMRTEKTHINLCIHAI